MDKGPTVSRRHAIAACALSPLLASCGGGSDSPTDDEEVLLLGSAPPSWMPVSQLAKIVESVGFSYDPGQDIIFSRMDPIQRQLGFMWAYDDASPTLSMIIDAEPVYFSYDGKQWMIELWKGQYGLESGGEIGVYNRLEHWWAPPDRGWFASADNDDCLRMAFTLRRKDGQLILSRGPALHWWLTGFRWGVFNEPEDLTMAVSITLKNETMLGAFHQALYKLGYRNMVHDGKTTVHFTFDRPFTGQPYIRSVLRDSVQVSNRALVASYNKEKSAAGLIRNDPNDVTSEDSPHVFNLLRGWLTSSHR